MIKETIKSEGPAPKRSRRTQERTETARNNLIIAATPMFAEQGFDAISARDIETVAKVNRGMLAYHFGSKDDLWKAVADNIFKALNAALEQRLVIIKEVSKREGVALLIRFHVRYYAEHPELSRLMSQEARQDSWRIRYLTDTHVRPSVTNIKKYIAKELKLTDQQFAHWYYIMVSASATIFSFESECKMLFGFNPISEESIIRHAEMLVGMLLKDG